MAEGPDSQAIKNLLDNPVVSDDVKRELIWAYGSRHGDRAPDLQRYADRLGMTGTAGLRQSRISVGQQECDWAVWVAAVMS